MQQLIVVRGSLKSMSTMNGPASCVVPLLQCARCTYDDAHVKPQNGSAKPTISMQPACSLVPRPQNSGLGTRLASMLQFSQWQCEASLTTAPASGRLVVGLML